MQTVLNSISVSIIALGHGYYPSIYRHDGVRSRFHVYELFQVGQSAARKMQYGFSLGGCYEYQSAVTLVITEVSHGGA